MSLGVAVRLGGERKSGQKIIRASDSIALIGIRELVIIECNDENDGGRVYSVTKDQLAKNGEKPFASYMTDDHLAVEIARGGEETYEYDLADGIRAELIVRHLANVAVKPARPHYEL